MKKTLLLTLVVTPVLGLLTAVASAGGHSSAGTAGDAAAGEKKVAACTACHTPADFAGLSESAINSAIKKVAAGGLAGHPDVGSVSDQDIADLAAFLAKANQ